MIIRRLAFLPTSFAKIHSLKRSLFARNEKTHNNRVSIPWRIVECSQR